MNRLFRTVLLFFILASAILIPSCTGETETQYKMLIIAEGDTFTGHFLLNNGYYNFQTVGTWDTTVSGTYYYYVILTDIIKESKLSSLIVSATGTTSTTSIEYYLYKVKGDSTDLVDSSSDSPGYTGDIPYIKQTYNF
jgi:hypothetical protein